MNRTKIEWVRNPDGSQGFTWNPVTGCNHGCSYCYARRIAQRFSPPGTICGGNMAMVSKDGKPFPWGFAPTFYPDRLNEPLARKKPATIFVCSMADLFGSWVPAVWIESVLETVRQAPQHTFLFLTKNPQRYSEFTFPENCWLGATATDQDSWDLAVDAFIPVWRNWRTHPQANQIFISAEPLLGAIYPSCEMKDLGWLIIGSLTGPGRGYCDGMPNNDWADLLVSLAEDDGPPVFVKDNWPWQRQPYDHCPQGWPQELPEGMLDV